MEFKFLWRWGVVEVAVTRGLALPKGGDRVSSSIHLALTHREVSTLIRALLIHSASLITQSSLLNIDAWIDA